MLRRLYFITIVSVLLSFPAMAQNKSNRGKEFWLGYGYNYHFLNEPPVNTQELAIYISTEQAATVTVSVNGTSWSQTLNIPANTVDASVLIPKSGANDARVLADGFSNKGIHIVSDVPVAAYAHVYDIQLSGATMLMPVETYGLSYYSINYYQSTSQSNPPDWYSWFFVVASEDNTRVLITPSDSTKNGWLPGQTYTVNLNKGEMYHVFGKAGPFNTNNYALCSKDMTGSKVVSVAGSDGKCHLVAFFSGSAGIRLCRGDGGEFMHQQMFPLQAWGTRYLTYHTINNTTTNILETNRNLYRICVKDPSTVVKKNGVVMTGLNKGFFYEYMDSTGGDYIEADKPIIVSQYMVNKNQCWNYPTSSPSPPSYGDPEMFYLSPIEQGQKSVRFYVSRKSTIDYVYANIYLPTAAVGSLLVDGAPVPAANVTPHPNYPSYSIALTRFVGIAAQHLITCDSTFNATVYGLGSYESYGYNVGTLINNLNARSYIKNSFSAQTVDSFTCPKSPFRLNVQTAYRATALHWKLSGVPNLQPSADSVITNPIPVDSSLVNGRRYYRYTLQQDFTFSAPGTYTIPFSYTSPDIDACNNTETDSITVVVKPGPSADFSVSAARCLSDTIRFSGIANTGGFTLSQYLWTFQDVTTYTTLNVAKKFTTAGNQPIRFQVIATNGCTGDTTKTIVIDDVPLAKFGVSGASCSSDSLLISDSSTVANGSITGWRWEMGDGTILNRPNSTPFRYAYATPGNYIIKLTTTSSNGCKSDTAYTTITIFEKPTSLFAYDRNICIGDSVRFTDSSRISTGNIISWRWSFGDGTTATYPNNNPFYHPYIAAGTYDVKLVVQSSNGCISDTARKTVVVATKPSASISVNGIACVDSLRQFVSSNNSAPAGTTWWWNFGDGQTANAPANITNHAYRSVLANIIVKHVVSIGQGCASDTATFIIPAVYPNATALFTIEADTFCINKPVSFVADTTGIASWQWDFGNGTGNTVPPVTRSYSNAGNYTVSLVVKNQYNCASAPFAQPLSIYRPPITSAGPDKYIKPGGQTTLDATSDNLSQYSYSWSPAADLNSANVLNPIASPATTTEYSLLAIDNSSNCTATDKVIVNVYNGLYIPSAFTPNGDNKNEVWQIPGLAEFPDALVTVFNRWGEIVYQTKSYITKPWDGRIKGAMVSSSTTFIYVVQLNDAAKQVFKGTITIIQ
jgi:gliding motility-associated-like protein